MNINNNSIYSQIYVSTGIIINEKKNFLLEKNQSNSSFRNLLQFPGGKIENNETPYEALIREMKEELNINVTDATAFTFSSKKIEKKIFNVFFFIINDYHGNITSMINQELQWVPLDSLKSINTPKNNIEILELLFDRYK